MKFIQQYSEHLSLLVMSCFEPWENLFISRLLVIMSRAQLQQVQIGDQIGESLANWMNK